MSRRSTRPTTPTSTYRLQITAEFTLDDARAVIPHLSELGVDWVYLSPLLQAQPGSDHGYDVIDHSRIDSARGGRRAFEEFSRAAHDADMGVLVDIVPNHMGVATPKLNAWWWDLLTFGEQSRYAEAFDIDWMAGAGRVRIPVLGDGENQLDELTIVDGELAYYDNRYPLAPGTEAPGRTPREVHDLQHYELINWRLEDSELNYRRFFGVSSLAAIRVEVPWVFEQSHIEIASWFTGDEPLADGLRVDHPDGLADPGGYLDALSEAIGGAPIWVEKILEEGESLPATWRTLGTTGYDALGVFDRVFVDRAGIPVLQAAADRLNGGPSPEWHDLIRGTKRGIADGILGSEINRLARLVPDIDGAADAFAEIAATFPVYRSYLPLEERYLRDATRTAQQTLPERADVVGQIGARLAHATALVATRFQQTSGMVMAKGVEDTAFYRHATLTSLNEVGGDPSVVALSVGEFHARQASRQASLPHTMTTLSTHDTKRGEDIRARITELAEHAGAWALALDELHERAGFGGGSFEKLLWEAAVGSWPISRERLHAYAEKAAREGGERTTWTAPNTEFESAMHSAVDAAYDDPAVAAVLTGMVEAVRADGWVVSLGAKLVQLTSPGIPDLYQGSELWETSLVDPDNRRRVDFGVGARAVARLNSGALPPIGEDGDAKALVVQRALNARREHPEWFDSYRELPVLGPAARHAIAFDRGGAITVATRLPLDLRTHGGWRETILHTPARAYVEAITGRQIVGGAVTLRELLEIYPVALLTPAP